MDITVSGEKVYLPSEDIVARDVQGEFIIIPITSGIGESEDELWTLNQTGKALWDKLDGKQSLKDIAERLCLEFEASGAEIEKDLLGLLEELLKRKMVTELK